jgi:hypothetical protein
MDKTVGLDLFERVQRGFSEADLDSHAKVFYTGPGSLQKGKFVILGLNPTMPKPGTEDPTLRANLKASRHKEGNDNYHGASRLGGRFSKILDYTGEEPGKVFTSNVIFKRTRSAAELAKIGYSEAVKSWSVLKVILENIQPGLIIAFGTGPWSAYDYLHRFMKEEASVKHEAFSSGHSTWKVCRAVGKLAGNDITMVGVPHLSWYSPKPESEGIGLLLEEIETVKARNA